MLPKKKSILLQKSDGIFQRIGSFFAKSVFWKRIFLWGYPTLNRFFERGFWKSVMGRETDRSAWQYRFRRAGMKAGEQSFLMRIWKKGSSFLLASAVSSYGAFFLLFGAFLLIIRLFGGESDFFSAFLLPCVLMLASFPLLHEERSMAQCLLQSRIFSAFLFSFCEIPKEDFLKNSKGKDHKILTLLFVLLFGVISLWISPLVLIGCGILLFLLTFFAASPEALLVLLFALLPFLEYSKHPTLCLLLTALLIWVLWAFKLMRGRRTLRFGILDFFVLLLSLSFFFAGFIKGGENESFFAGTTRAVLLSLFFPSVALFKRSVWRRRAMIALECAGFFCALLGILQYVQGKAVLAWVDLSRFSDIGGRVTGCFSNPNILAVYLLLLLPLALSGACSKKESKYRRAFFALCFFAELLCLILTWSRGAWLGAMLSVFVFFLVFNRQTRSFLPFLAFPLLCIFSFLPRNLINRFQSIGSLSESSIRYRLYVWKGVGRMIGANPLGIGMGAENFSRQYFPYAVSGTETVIHTHQIFLQLLCELGIVGFLIFLSILLLLLLCLTQAERKRRYREERIGAACALLGALVMGLFDHIWYHYGNFALFWIIAALISAHISVWSEKRGDYFEA